MSFASLAARALAWGKGGATTAGKSYLGSGIHRAGAHQVRMGLGLRGSLGERLIGGGVGALVTYQGFREGGITGGAKALGENIAMNYAFGAAEYVLPYAAPIAAGALVGAAAWQGRTPMQLLARPAVRAHMRAFSMLEMGSPVADPLGTMATMRQRSLMAIQRSKINGRSALGQEASYMYRPYFR
jgi:hypothetical protein